MAERYAITDVVVQTSWHDFEELHDTDGISKQEFMDIIDRMMSGAGASDTIWIRTLGYDEELESE